MDFFPHGAIVGVKMRDHCTFKYFLLSSHGVHINLVNSSRFIKFQIFVANKITCLVNEKRTRICIDGSVTNLRSAIVTV